MEEVDDLRGEERRVISTKLYKVEFNLLRKICEKEGGKSVHAKLRELVKKEIQEKMGWIEE